MSPTGTLTKKIHSQPTASTRKPPSSGPTYEDTLYGYAPADMYPVDVTSTASHYYVVDPGRYSIFGVNRATSAIDYQAGGTRGALLLDRDHLDTGSVASPNRETEAMRDGCQSNSTNISELKTTTQGDSSRAPERSSFTIKSPKE